MKTPLGTEVYLGPGHIVLDGYPAVQHSPTGHSSPLFTAHVYCGLGRPSQLLLSSFMVALWNRADHYIFILWFLSIYLLFFFPRLI